MAKKGGASAKTAAPAAPKAAAAVDSRFDVKALAKKEAEFLERLGEAGFDEQVRGLGAVYVQCACAPT